jgi:hypothetical protein
MQIGNAATPQRRAPPLPNCKVDDPEARAGQRE